MILRDYRTGGGHFFMPLFNLRIGAAEVRLERGGVEFRTAALPAGVGVAGFLKTGSPKDWSPRDDPEGFLFLLELLRGDMVHICRPSAGTISARWTFGMPGLFGTVMEGSPFFQSLSPKPWWRP